MKHKRRKEATEYLKNHVFFKQYLGGIDFSKYKYIKVDYSKNPQCVGLLDTVSQFNDYIKFSYYLGLKLIAPSRRLQQSHNDGRPSDFVFSEYFDVNSIKVGQTEIKLAGNIESLNPDDIITIEGLGYVTPNYYQPESGLDLICFRKMLRELPACVSYDPCEKYINLADDFVRKNQIEGCIHIRRGDRLDVGASCWGISPHEWDHGTRSENILNFLDSRGAPKAIYIMTDMKADDQILSELRKSNYYNFSFLYDHEELVSLKQKNNYEVFHLESCIKDSNLIKFKADRFDPVFYYKNHL